MPCLVAYELGFFFQVCVVLLYQNTFRLGPLAEAAAVVNYTL